MATEQEQAAVIRALAGTERPVIVDLGAHHGEEFAWINGLFGPLAAYIAVEADPRNAAILRRRIARYPGVVVIDAAIAAHEGTVVLHLCDNTADQAKGSSSIHKPTGHLDHFPWCTFEDQVTVRATTLDSLVCANLPLIDLLWVDIQGAEKSCILGGTETLKRTRYIMMEAEEVEMYEGQALKPELLSMLPDFDLVHDFGYNIFLRNRNL